MRTIQYERKDSIAPIMGCPFEVCAGEFKMLLPGRIVTIKTGLKIYLPENLSLKVDEVINDNLSVISVDIRDSEVVMIVCAFGCADMYFIRPNDKIAKLRIINLDSTPIRFVDMTGGKRSMYGGPSSVEISQ